MKNTKFWTLNTKLTDLDNKYHDAATLIHINQCNRHQQNVKIKMKILKNNIRFD